MVVRLRYFESYHVYMRQQKKIQRPNYISFIKYDNASVRASPAEDHHRVE